MEQQTQAAQGKSSRGPYRVLSSGQMPKRKPNDSISRLVEKAAARGHELEIVRKRNKRQTNKIERIEEELESANQKLETVEEQAKVSEDLILRLQEEIARLREDPEKKDKELPQELSVQKKKNR